MFTAIYSQRARRWNCSAWMARWVSQIADHCLSPQGWKDVEKWTNEHYGRVEAQELLRYRHVAIVKRIAPYAKNPTFDDPNWSVVSTELGIHLELLKLLQEYELNQTEETGHSPPRAQPAPRRRRGESSVEWTARRHKALTNGAKLPDFDWQATRAIVVSELDRVRDTMESLRTSPKLFYEAIMTKKAHLIFDGETIRRADAGDVESTFEMLEKASNHVKVTLQISHFTWSLAEDVFSEMAARGLTTSRAIERAFKADTAFYCRLVACFARITQLHTHYWGELRFTLTSLPAFCRYFRRSESGPIIIDVDHNYTKRSRYNDSRMDELVVKSCRDGGLGSLAFFDTFLRAIRKTPAEANKFDNAAYAELGDYSVVQEVFNNVWWSPVGQALHTYSVDLQSRGMTPANVLREVSPFEGRHLPNRDRGIMNRWGEASTIMDWTSGRMHTFLSWPSEHSHLPPLVSPVHRLGEHCWAGLDHINIPMAINHDKLWTLFDAAAWKEAHTLDWPNTPGRVAREFGLVNPKDPGRPLFMKTLLRKSTAPKMIVPSTENYVDTVPVTHPSERSTQSGHAFSAQTESKPKTRSKKKGQQEEAVPLVDNLVEQTNGMTLDEEPIEEELPGQLPATFQLPRKIMKTFQTLLDSAGENDSDNAPKRGQLRWADFEKAMTRVGFAMVQAAGSSVRFDPPAKSARPISFHRPHPDSTLTPPLCKWIGARLYRCYGWTMATFVQAADDGQ